MSETVSNAIEKRVEGDQPGRTKAVVAALVVGFGAAVAMYKILRSSDGD